MTLQLVGTFIFYLGLLQILQYPQQSFQQSIPGFIFELDEFTYKIILEQDDPRTWVEAEEICREEEGGHLASVTTDKENKFLNEKIRLVVSQRRNEEKLWIGAIDEHLYGEFSWVDGKPFRYAAAELEVGERTEREYETCLLFISTYEEGNWKEVDCYTPRGYICKIKGKPKRLIERQRFSYAFDHGRAIYKYFLMQNDMLTWPEAEYYCVNVEYGHLLSITSTKENKKIAATLRRLRWIVGFTKLWVGASDFYDEGNFQWSNNDSFNFQKWAPGHPMGEANGRKRDCMAITSTRHLGRWEDEYCMQHLPFICKLQVCAQRADIAFAVDASSSVTMNGFISAKDFVKSVISGVKTSRKTVRIGLIRFSTRVKLVFPFNKFYWWRSLYRAIDAMEYSQGGTRTDRALNMARTQLFSEAGGAREGVPRMLVLMTDGRSTAPTNTLKEAYLLKKSGVYVLVVAIGKRVVREELESIASRPEAVISASSYTNLRKIVDETRKRLCEVDDPHEGLTLRKY